MLEARITAQWSGLADHLRAIPPDELAAARARYESMALGAGSPDDRLTGRVALAAIDEMARGVDPLTTLVAVHQARVAAAQEWAPITRESVG